ncbi:MAG: hypothetical protein WCK34_00575 [Bacteroidota bacterium]
MEQQDAFEQLRTLFDFDKRIEIVPNEYSVKLAISEIVKNWENIGLENLLELLLRANKIAITAKLACVSCYCKSYVLECCLALGKYEDYLTHSNLPKIYSINDVGLTNTRLSVQKELGMEANPIDVYRTHFPRQSKIVKSNPKLFEEKIIAVFQSYAKERGGWFNLFENKKFGALRKGKYTGSFPPPLDWGKIEPKFGFQFIDYVEVAMKELHATIKGLTIEAENQIRSNYGLSEIEIPWRTESLLYRRIKNEFPSTTVILHGQPEWLGRQHFDIWMPEWKIAVEFQGLYHFEPINGEDELEKTIARDKRKMELAIKNGVILFYETSSDHEDLVRSIRNYANDNDYNQ